MDWYIDIVFHGIRATLFWTISAYIFIDNISIVTIVPELWHVHVSYRYNT